MNKKVLLRERKRHIARRVVSIPCVVLTGYPAHPDLSRGVPCWGGYPGRVPPGIPPGRVLPVLAQWGGYPWQGTPSGRVPPWLDLAGYPPRCLPHGILGNVSKHYGIWVPPLGVCPMAFWVMLQSIMGYGYPPLVWTN